jgi:hypothetical protein
MGSLGFENQMGSAFYILVSSFPNTQEMIQFQYLLLGKDSQIPIYSI